MYQNVRQWLSDTLKKRHYASRLRREIMPAIEAQAPLQFSSMPGRLRSKQVGQLDRMLEDLWCRHPAPHEDYCNTKQPWWQDLPHAISSANLHRWSLPDSLQGIPIHFMERMFAILQLRDPKQVS
jgi:hypothetical protein